MAVRPRMLVNAFSGTLTAYKNCLQSGNSKWIQIHNELLEALEKHLPHGAGFDAGTWLDVKASSTDRLVFTTSVHRMNGDGYYVGWSEFVVTASPSFLVPVSLDVVCASEPEKYDNEEDQEEADFDAETLLDVVHAAMYDALTKEVEA